MLVFLTALLAILPSILRSRAAVELENLALRHQIGVLQRSAARRPKLTSGDRLFWICLSRLWCDWQGLNSGEGQVQRVSLSDIITVVDSPLLAEAHSPAHICFCGPA